MRTEERSTAGKLKRAQARLIAVMLEAIQESSSMMEKAGEEGNRERWLVAESGGAPMMPFRPGF